MGKRLENISESLMELLQKDKRIEEEQVYVFFEGAVDCLNGEEDKTAKLDKLAAYLQKKWQYREIESMTSEQAFLCGSIWGGTRLLGLKRERKEKTFRFEELKKQYTGHYGFLRAIAANPGIKHKDLAVECGKSVSLLSQFATGVKKDGLITCRRIGRETYYYLRPLGEQVYEEIEQEKQKELEWQNIFIPLQEKTWMEEFRRQQNIKELKNTFYKGWIGAKEDDFEVMGYSNNYLPIHVDGMIVEDNYESVVSV